MCCTCVSLSPLPQSTYPQCSPPSVPVRLVPLWQCSILFFSSVSFSFMRLYYLTSFALACSLPVVLCTSASLSELLCTLPNCDWRTVILELCSESFVCIWEKALVLFDIEYIIHLSSLNLPFSTALSNMSLVCVWLAPWWWMSVDVDGCSTQFLLLFVLWFKYYRCKRCKKTCKCNKCLLSVQN